MLIKHCACLPEDGVAALPLATSKGKIDLVDTLLGQPGFKVTADALYYAARNNEMLGMLATLLEWPEGDISRPDKVRRTPLHHAAKANVSPDIMRLLLQRGETSAASSSNAETVRAFLELPGANAGIRDEYGFPVLHSAAESGPLEVVNLLLTRPGVDVASYDDLGCAAMVHTWGAPGDSGPILINDPSSMALQFQIMRTRDQLCFGV